ncbi:M1 family metallopeptidase [Pedobacter sp.]|uniref:M1 family metallopeptidase n=1 Tax=Pedobacter sp. TaxID=1411316 RepID=UPI003D7F2E0F
MSVKYLLLLLSLTTATYAQQKEKSLSVVPGVSLDLAIYRKSVISDIQYTLHFNIPSAKQRSIVGTQHISFLLNKVNQDLQIDFKQSAENINSIKVNGVNVAVKLINEHILIDHKYLKKGANEISIDFIAGDQSLNRNEEYLYALFVPALARTVFPCFDQPDLKANFQLSLTVPKQWHVLANGTKKDSLVKDSIVTYHFANTEKLPTYLFSFTAGKYKKLQQIGANRNMEFLHRETDARKIDLSVDSVFKAHGDALNFLEQWTGIPYPFQKFGFVAVPDFQFGGMEHPGEIRYKASSLFLDEGATKDQYIARSNLISHETAHMWFGDLVTMQWFNDVWMKEVFANFMADKVTEKMMGQETFNLKFLQDHYPAAYGVDRTLGANPIRQQLDNLQDAGSMYGNIIYHKAPIMMRQLEELMGKDNFQKGIRQYLKEYSYKNATWNDLIKILNKFSTADLEKWNKVWVNQPGRPVFTYGYHLKGDKISQFKISQEPETGPKRIWPQVFSITLIYADHQQIIPVNMDKQTVLLKAVEGLEKPDAILFNSDGMGYGVFPVNQLLNKHLFALESPLERASAYLNAYENMLSGKSFKPGELLKLYAQGIGVEKNEMNLQMLSGYITQIYWKFITQKDRLALSPDLEKALWNAMLAQKFPNLKKVLFNAYQNIYLTEEAKMRIYNIWLNQKAPAGVKLLEDDYTALALTIALKTDTVSAVMQQQLSRIKNQDRRDRLSFIIPALSANVQDRDQFFYSLRQLKNRQKEAWVTTALFYLHHPLRQSSSQNYLQESLVLLNDIQKTGDIFFPQSWLAAVFGNYQNKEAYQVVTEFLKQNPAYPSNLKDKILQSTDNLFRAQKLLDPLNQ